MMYTVLTYDFGTEVFQNKYTAAKVTGKTMCVQFVHPEKDNTVFVIPGHVVDTFIDTQSMTVKLDGVAGLDVYKKENYTQVASLQDLGGYTVDVIFTEMVFPISPGDNYVSSEIKKYLFSIGKKAVAPQIKTQINAFINELNRGQITDSKMDRVNKFLNIFGARISKIEITSNVPVQNTNPHIAK